MLIKLVKIVLVFGKRIVLSGVVADFFVNNLAVEIFLA